MLTFRRLDTGKVQYRAFDLQDVTGHGKPNTLKLCRFGLRDADGSGVGGVSIVGGEPPRSSRDQNGSDSRNDPAGLQWRQPIEPRQPRQHISQSKERVARGGNWQEPFTDERRRTERQPERGDRQRRGQQYLAVGHDENSACERRQSGERARDQQRRTHARLQQHHDDRFERVMQQISHARRDRRKNGLETGEHSNGDRAKDRKSAHAGRRQNRPETAE